MILKLPLEIILDIASHLQFEDKLNLKLTCHKLNDLISRKILFQELNLWKLQYQEKKSGDTSKNGDKIIQEMIDIQFDGSLVKVLHLDFDDLSNPVFSQLSELFPNPTRVIYSKIVNVIYPNPSDYLQKFDQVTNPLIKWRNTIKEIDTCYDWEVLKSDLMYFKYPALTKLDVHNASVVFNACATDSNISFFKNMPLLETLTLRQADISLEILEAIHAGSPLIKSLSFFDCNIDLKKKNILSLPITPADNVLSFKMNDFSGYNKDGDILDYAWKKYKNLRQLEYNIDPEADYYMEKLKESERLHLDDYESDEESTLDRIARFEEIFREYRVFESFFFRDPPKSLEFLTLHIDYLENAVVFLSESGVNLKMLDLRTRGESVKTWDSLYKLKYLEKLASLKTLKIGFGSAIQSFTSNIISFSITKLVIELYRGTFYVDWILSKFPSLEELYITKSYTEIRGRSVSLGNDEEVWPGKTYNNLRILNIKSEPVCASFFDYIKTAAPRLEVLDLELQLSRFSLSKEAVHTIDLSGWYLNKCRISVLPSMPSSQIYSTISIDEASNNFVFDYKNKCLTTANQNDHDGRYEAKFAMIFEEIECLKVFDFSITKHEGDIKWNL